MYPEERGLQTDRLPEHVAMVQSAADQYWEQNRRFPIKEDPGRAKASPYEKYVVDFSKLEGYIGQIPPSAFEMGGHFLYVLVVSENKMQVRLVDLRVADRLRDLQVAVDAFRDKKKRLPTAASAGEGFYAVDFQAMGLEEERIPSPYTAGLSLPLVMDRQGRLYVDYRPEILRLLQEGKRKRDEAGDLREWLIRDSIFVPARSPGDATEGRRAGARRGGGRLKKVLAYLSRPAHKTVSRKGFHGKGMEGHGGHVVLAVGGRRRFCAGAPFRLRQSGGLPGETG